MTDLMTGKTKPVVEKKVVVKEPSVRTCEAARFL